MAANMSTSARDDAPTTELVAGTVGSHCATCHAPLAPDQRYCLNCGERRGKARFPAPTGATQTTTESVTQRRPPRRSGPGAGLTLVAGVATLLIALGVGVLIGHDASPSQRASAPQVVTVGGGGAAGTAANSTAGSAQSSGGHAKKAAHAASTKKQAKTKTVVVHLTPKVAKAASNAASKVFGQNGRLSKNVTQSVGGKCSGGAGCQNGKFTGNFFGQ